MNKKIVITLERQFGSGGLEIGKRWPTNWVYHATIRKYFNKR